MKTGINIQTSSNYSLFESNPLQQSFSNRKVQHLMNSMRKDGWWRSFPASVYQLPGGKYRINAGHHRIAAAIQLGIPILFIVENAWTEERLAGEGEFNTKWKSKDQAIVFAKKGIPDYVELLEIVGKGMPLHLAASMLIGEGAGSGNARAKISNGSFKIKSRTQMNQWLALHEEFGGRVPALYHKSFIHVYSKCLFTPEFDNDIFVKRLRRNPLMLDKMSSEDQTLKLVEELYNFGSPNKIPLAFLVSKNSKERKHSFGREAA